MSFKFKTGKLFSSHPVEYGTASLVYKMGNDLAPTHTKSMFIKSSEVHSYSTRSAASGDFHLPKINLNIRKSSFFLS